MREMKDSGVEWIGDIPSEWSIDKIVRCFDIIGSGTTPKTTDDSQFEGKVNWIQSGDINGGILSNTRFQITQEVVDSTSALKVYNAPFIVIAMYGASIGNLSISQIDACTNQACCVLSKPTGGIDFEYLFYAFKPAKDYLIWKADGGGQPNISQDKVKGLWVPIPPSCEQKCIVKYLNLRCGQVDALIANVQAQIEKLKAYKQSLITEVVTKGLDPAAPMKDSGVEWVKRIPTDWDMLYPKALFVQRKDRARPDDRQLTASQQYGIMDQEEYMAMTGTRVVVVEKDFDILKHVEVGDFVISMRSFQGGLEYSEVSGCISSAYVMLKPSSERVYSRYYRWLLKSSLYINAIGSTSNLVRDGQAMRYANFIKIWLPCPPMGEQQSIADYLDEKCPQIDRLIAIKQSKIEKLEQYKRSLIYEYVTGKKEV